MRKGRGLIVAMLVISLLATAGTRQLGLRSRLGQATTQAAIGSRSSLASMSSFSLALLLGGLRGPLVMVLWTQSENLKNEKNLQGVDTLIEWIRLLQPEFDTVHIFQIWNKAYNISVQMASLANKYTTILDALDYARSVDQERPDNINILIAEAQVFFDKLGNSQEKDYYRNRVRAESLPHRSRQSLKRNDPAWRRLDMDSLLDASGNILPQYLAPHLSKPASVAADGPWNDGSELQYLKPYQPFPYGLSPFALAYNYYQRGQVLQNVYQQRHAQLSPLVIDSRPALALKNWAEDEMTRGRGFELRLLDQSVPPLSDSLAMELPTASLAPDGLNARQAASPLLAGALYSYELSARLCRDATAEYHRHLTNPDYAMNVDIYQSHLDHMRGIELLMEADAAYLRATSLDAAARAGELAKAKEFYQRAAHQFRYLILHYYTADEIAAETFPKGYTKANIQQLSGEELRSVLAAVNRAITAQGTMDQYVSDREEYDRYLERIASRLKHL